MSKSFLKKDQVSLINGGYLSDNEGTPIYNKDFVNAQLHAEYVITFAEKAKDKDFIGKKADSLEEFKNEVNVLLYGSKVTEFVKAPKAPKKELGDKLKQEALDFVNFQSKSDETDKINNFLSHFEIISEFEEFGLYFKSQIIKLNKIYSMKEVISAVVSVIALLD